MNENLVIHGKVFGQTFVPDEPMPNIEGSADLIVYPKIETTFVPTPPTSIFDFIGKATEPRSAEDLDAQLREERNAWGDS